MKYMQDVRAEIVPLIRDVCQRLMGHVNENEVSLLLGTAAAESGLIFRKQLDDGPARGLWQMEPRTGVDIFEHYLKFKPAFHMTLMSLWIDLRHVPYWTPAIQDMIFHLEINDDFACAMARIHYLRDPDPIPDSVEEQARYWKRVYNTPAGAGTVEHYLEMWESCGCAELLEA